MLLNNYLLKFYFLVITAIFAGASSYYLSGGTATIGLFPELYYFKHASLIFLAFLGILFFTIRRNYKLNIIFIFMIPYIFYLSLNYGIVFIQILSLLIAATLISYIYNIKSFLDSKIIFIFFLIICFIPLIDYLLNNSSFIFNSFYGRERLLLGYFHPKEAGIMFVSLIVMILLTKTFKNNLSKLLFYVLSSSLLYFIQSRNALLFLLNFLVFNFIANRFGLKISLVLYLLVYLFIPLLIISIYFNEIDLLMSYRLSIWIESLQFNMFGRLLEFSANSNEILFKSKFHIDNFYLEFLIEVGIIPFLFLVTCLSYIGYKIRNTVINGYKMISIYIAFLIFCFFDSGMFSTGNFLNVFVWSIIIFLIREKRNLLENNLR